MSIHPPVPNQQKDRRRCLVVSGRISLGLGTYAGKKSPFIGVASPGPYASS